jgi:hypothetical protein
VNTRAGVLVRLLGLSALSALLAAGSAAAAPGTESFEQQHASREARHVAHWVIDSGDNHNGDNVAGNARKLPFAIIDKKDARVFVFDAEGKLLGAAPVLLGMGHGDVAIPGIGDREMSTLAPRDRTTPAGRFVASLGIDSHGVDVLWVDYEGAVALHRVITTNPKERRLHRLATPTPADNRISFGCINAPVVFYENVVRPAFEATYGIVYVLPETRTAQGLFGSYEVEGKDSNEKDEAASPLKKVSAVKLNQKKAIQ